LVGGAGADDFLFSASSNGVDTIIGFVAGTDDLDMTTNGVILSVVTGSTITSAGAAGDLLSTTLAADDTVHYISMNGAAANLTTGGTKTLSTSDLTATTLTNLAAYLDERFNGDTSGTSSSNSILVINWTASGSRSSYVYEFVNNLTDDAIQAGELTLIGIVDRGSKVLAVGDVI
jgi:hypothetical protein